MIGWQDGDGKAHRGSLFATFAALARGEAWSFPALRPHQREPWHAFTVQVAALALIGQGLETLPQDEGAWRDLLLTLTPDHPDGAAWQLVVDDWSRPALLQPPVVVAANRADYDKALSTPDRLDMLVISRNHEIKRERMVESSPEDWLFALVTLQTMEGQMGSGRYGISRMNSGYGTRMALGVRPARGGAAEAFRRDVLRLVTAAAHREDRRRGLALLWTDPWDGTLSLNFTKLDELYVDTCRRVRLRRASDGTIEAVVAGSKRTRVAADQLGGNTGDPWAPLVIDTKKGRSTEGKLISFPVTGEGFGYRQMTRLLDRQRTTAPLLAQLHEDDAREGLSFVAAALVRGQGKTEGLHRRTVRTSRMEELYEYGPAEALDRIGHAASRRAHEAGEVSRKLRRALIMLMSGGKERDDLVRARDGDAEAWTAALRRYDALVDRDFFDTPLWKEAETPELPDHKRTWREKLRFIAETTLAEAIEAAPRSETRRLEAVARAENKLKGLMDAWMRELADGEHA